MFLWCACANVLPTKENLNRRRIQVDLWCEIYCQQPESVGHLLWECPLAQNVWALCRGGLQKCQNNLCDFILLFRTLLDGLSKTDLERWAVTSWAIWNARNKFYFEKTQSHPKDILNGALGYLQEYQKLPEVANGTTKHMKLAAINLDLTGLCYCLLMYGSLSLCFGRG